MKDFLITLLPKTPVYTPSNADLDASLNIIDQCIWQYQLGRLTTIKEGLLLINIDLSLFPLFEKEYGLPSFFDYADASDEEKERIIKAKIFISRNGIVTLEDYKYLASLFDIRDINIQTYNQAFGNGALDIRLDAYFFNDPSNGNFIFIVDLPTELEELAIIGTFDAELDYEFDSPTRTIINFKKLMRQLLPITHDIEYYYTL